MRFEYVHPVGGNELISVKITPTELEYASDDKDWEEVLADRLHSIG